MFMIRVTTPRKKKIQYTFVPHELGTRTIVGWIQQGLHENVQVAVGWLRENESLKQHQRSFALHQPLSSSHI